MRCWNCRADFPTPRSLSFRAVCELCGSDLHTCRGCKFFQEGKPNNCLIPGTEWVSDRTKNNYCEEFAPLENLSSKPEGVKQRFDDLFK